MRGIEFKNQVGDLLRQITFQMDTVFRPIFEAYGLTMMQARILFQIKQGKLFTIGSLANVAGLSSGNASTMCKKLERAGFIKRTRNVEDERVVKLELNELGEKIIKEIDEALQEKYAVILESKVDQDFEMIIAGLEKLNDLLGEMVKSCDE